MDRPSLPTRAKPIWAALPPGLHVIRVGRRPTFTTYVLRGGPGPVAVLNGGTHGDEYEGPTVLRELAETLDPRQLRGTLVLIPVLHEDAFFAATRCHPEDGSNLARVFPGHPRGNRAERVAHLFLERVLRHASHYIDFHSGGMEFDLRQWCGYMLTERPELDRIQAEMAACFDDYWCWGSIYARGRTISSAADLGIPAIYTESIGGGGVAAADLRSLRRGIRNFLVRFGYLAGRLSRLKHVPIRIARSKEEAHIQTHHPTPVAGLFVPVVALGEKVRKGALIGRVHPLEKRAAIPIDACQGGTVVALRRQRSIKVGDPTATIVPLGRAR